MRENENENEREHICYVYKQYTTNFKPEGIADIFFIHFSFFSFFLLLTN